MKARVIQVEEKRREEKKKKGTVGKEAGKRG